MEEYKEYKSGTVSSKVHVKYPDGSSSYSGEYIKPDGSTTNTIKTKDSTGNSTYSKNI